MGYDERQSVIVDSVACGCCPVPKGTPCVPAPESYGDMHGARIDDFRCEAPYEARLFVHVDTVRGSPSDWRDFVRGSDFYLTEEELLALDPSVYGDES